MPTPTIRTTENVSAATATACVAAAWNCQTHSFMGSPETVSANLADLPADLIERRVYMLMVQGDDRAEARIFERFNLEDTDGTVGSWAEDNVSDMITQITEVLVGNRGVHCPGEQVKATLETERDVKVSAPAPAPKTAAEAFGPIISEFADDKFVQATVMVLC